LGADLSLKEHLVAQPNIVIILADDLGYSDIAPFGGEIDTPSLERLSWRGVRMSSYYVTPRCSPSRAALLTGRHPHSVGIGVLTSDNRPVGYPGSLDTEVPTLAELLSAQGYTTGLFGKWHLASEFHVPSDTWPTRRGFDEFRGILQGAASYYNPPMVHGETPIPARDLPDDFHFTEDVTASGVDFIQRHGGSEHPFFLMLTYTAPHWPLHSREQTIAKYRERFSAGWNAMREERLRRLLDQGLVPGVSELPQDQVLPDWADAGSDWEIERMAVYAAQVESLDRGIGRILDALSERDMDEDTLVIFLSDNGGCAEELEIGMDSYSEDICPRFTRAGAPVSLGNDPEVLPGPENTYQSYGQDWATVSNTPFRLWKRWVHEGGISTPFIVSWPAGGIDSGGSVSHAVGHITDILPSVLDAAGLSDDGAEGESLLPMWRNVNDPGEERTLFWEHMGNAAVRRGPWKLVREWGGEWELFDVETDRTESTDLAEIYPALVAELQAEYHKWAVDHGVIPWQRVLNLFESRGLPSEQAAS
jgi:arylsulfatase